MEAILDKKESFEEIINGDTLVLVDFSAEWCGPCKIVKPVLEELQQRMGGMIRIIKIDIDKSPALAETWQIESVPTLVLFQKGAPLWRRSGVPLALQLEKIVRSYLIAE